MSPFNFQSVLSLDIKAADKPNIDIQNDYLVLTATRDGDQIRITAPLNSVMPQRQEQKKVQERKPTRNRKARRYRQQQPGTRTYYFKPGEDSPMAKLTEEKVAEIRSLATDKSYRNEFSSEHAMLKTIAKAYEVHYTTIYQIVRGTTWKHVESK
jgi:Mor family transcriptional regulator